tara:strand:- start:251 stop:448 length:198 start_codon:yes stop_codon:yes gene_type:complete
MILIIRFYFYKLKIFFVKLLKRYKLKSRGKLEIIKVAKKGFSNCSNLNRIPRKIEFKESIKNKNK